jgi:hypothetical protein
VICRQGCPVSGGHCRYPGASDASDTVPPNSLYTHARVRASRKVTTTCVRSVRRCAKTRGPISATQPANRLQTRASIEFSILAVFTRPGCKPANLQTGYAPGFAATLFLSIPHTPALTGHSAYRSTPPGANRKPCKPCFLVGRWRNAALAPPVLEYRQEGPPFAWGGTMGSGIVSPRCGRQRIPPSIK